MTGRARGETTQMAKTCKILKNAKNASKFSKFLGFAARRMLMSVMMSERSLGQDTERVGLLSRFCALTNHLGSGDCNFDISLKP